MKTVYVIDESSFSSPDAFASIMEEMLEASPQLMREVKVILSAPPQFPSFTAYAPRKRRYNRRNNKPF